MKFGFAVLLCLLTVFFSCRKDSYITSPDAHLVSRADTLKFDTVFTTLGSVTKSFTIVNDNDQKLKIDRIALAGGAASSFAINVNGSAGTSFTDLEMRANDSLYVFVKITVDPGNVTTPFIILDSLQIDFNGTSQKVFLQAFGQNARFISNQTIATNTVWDNTLPYVIMNQFAVAKDATLTIQKGTRVYVQATAPIIINGTLKTEGGRAQADHVIFRSSRIDEGYRDIPGTWPGIIFSGDSRNNRLQYTDVLNAYQSLVVVGGAAQAQPQLSLEECVIHNAYDIGILGYNSYIYAQNCLVSQCGNNSLPGVGGSNILITAGGKYDFQHCTVATYANLYQTHKLPVLYVSNTDGAVTAPLRANFTNCIFYGERGEAEDELIVNKAASDIVDFANVIYKLKSADPQGVTFTDCIRNQAPQFDSINTNLQTFNFRLRDTSPAIDAGRASAIPMDLDGNPRPVGIKPDMGAYERQ